MRRHAVAAAPGDTGPPRGRRTRAPVLVTLLGGLRIADLPRAAPRVNCSHESALNEFERFVRKVRVALEGTPHTLVTAIEFPFNAAYPHLFSYIIRHTVPSRVNLLVCLLPCDCLRS